MDHPPTPDGCTVIPAADARALSLYTAEERARHYARKSRAANTRRAYRSDWADFTAWCQAHGHTALPATPATLVLYLSDRAQTLKTLTLQRRLTSIAQAHKAADLDTPTADRAVRRIARACASSGWSVDIEHTEADWRADVLAERGGQRVAFEVQWSRQTLAETEVRQARYRAAGVRGCWFFRYPPRALRRPGRDTDLEARRDLPLFSFTAGGDHDGYRAYVDGRPHPLGQVVGALLGGRIAFRPHRTVLGAHVVDIAFHDKVCPSCGAPCRVYRVATREEAVPRAPCGGRVLLWSGTPYHPDVAHAARRLYGVGPRHDDIPLAFSEPTVGFQCPGCRARLAPPATRGGAIHAVALAADVTFTRPLYDPYPHWCYPPDGSFCAAIVADDG